MTDVATSTTQSGPEADAPETVTMPLAKAINAGLRRAMEDDDKVIQLGEDIGTLGGVFRVTEGLQAEFGDRRVLDTPLAESGIVGTAIGLQHPGHVVAVGLVAAHVRPHVAGGNQSDRMALALEPAAPVVRAAADFHQHPHRRALLHDPGKCLA